MTTGSTGSTFPKWQLAILIGAPVALGIGYLYWKKSTEAEEPDDKLTKKKLGEIKEKTISLDGESSHDTVAKRKTLTPLEEAQKHKNEGNVHFREAKYDQAIKEYDLAIEKCPASEINDLSTFYQNRAAAYEHLQKWNSVIDDCIKALECNPKYLKALKRRAKAYEQLKELAKSLEDITAACILEGFQNKHTLVLADRVLKELGQQHAKEALKDKHDVQPSKFFVKNYFASFADDPVRKMVIVSSEPKGFVKAKQLLDQGEYEGIVAACTEEIESSEAESEHKVEAILLRATFYLLTARYAEATVDLDTVIGTELADKKLRANALIKRASLAMQTQPNLPEECFKYFSKAEELDPSNSDIYHHRGQVYILIERLSEAISDFEKACSLCPNSGMIAIHKCYANYRQAMINKDEYALRKVMEGFRDAIDRFPDCVECYSLMAQVLCDQQEFQEADNFFEKATKIEPENAQILVHKALLQLQWKADLTAAVKLIEEAIKIDDKCEFAYETLGTIQVQRGHLTEAIRLFECAINLAKTEMELVHLYSLKDAAIAQVNVTKNMGLDIHTLGQFV
ncbi:mitochondrial import receptor subunit TOM70 [Wyeomyia smithii]|uniref:mitochondrial import receptor subunit TOM70 n=1 Tax=Wyeomyia smithii TaxID=174621 RepID=UPI002468007C|nr:mitochondrial import receptor subunit TOM70 [Wyeomyia smithii]XP_055539128.1 mitochondrial import receptor subunit TOM70 [Wyeomyia smithii]XP_055539129.1 mitochondrial import receptor subunit TOM70 [Wyeomyia smithii]